VIPPLGDYVRVHVTNEHWERAQVIAHHLVTADLRRAFEVCGHAGLYLEREQGETWALDDETTTAKGVA
jgi:hypothetical protein